MEDYVQFGYSIGVDMSVGFLYTKIDENRVRFPDKLSTGMSMQDFDLPREGGNG